MKKYSTWNLVIKKGEFESKFKLYIGDKTSINQNLRKNNILKTFTIITALPISQGIDIFKEFEEYKVSVKFLL